MRLLNSGFTIIELLVVLALFVIITTLSINNVGFLHRSVARAELNHLYSVCRYLQYKALASKQKQILTLDSLHNSYTYGELTHKMPTTICFGVVPGIKGPPAAPHKIITHPVTFKNDTIVFHPDGIVSSGSVYLHDARTNSLYALSNGIAQVSFFRLYHYNSAWKMIFD